MSRSRSRSPAEQNSTVFVGNLNHDSDERAIKEFFTQFGNVLEVKIIYDKETQRPRGFGFVKFDDPRDADDAIRNGDGKVLDGRILKCNIAKYPNRNNVPFRGGYQGGRAPMGYQGRGRGDYGPPGRGNMGPPRDSRGPPPRRSRSRSAGRYSPGRYSPARYTPGPSYSGSYSRSASPPPKRRRPASDIRPPTRRPPVRGQRSGSFTGSGSYTGSDYSTTDSAASRSPRRRGAPPAAAAAAAPVQPAVQPPPPAAFKKELMQAKKREDELATKVSVMESEVQAAQATAAQVTASVEELKSQLSASEKTAGKYREWLVALAECSKAVVSARAEEAAAAEKVKAAETDLQLFIKEADDVLGQTAPATGGSHRRGHRRRRERPAGEAAEAATNGALAAGEAPPEGGWGGDGEGMDANASAMFKPGIKFKLAT